VLVVVVVLCDLLEERVVENDAHLVQQWHHHSDLQPLRPTPDFRIVFSDLHGQ
jgi:hypothetical protein